MLRLFLPQSLPFIFLYLLFFLPCFFCSLHLKGQIFIPSETFNSSNSFRRSFLVEFSRPFPLWSQPQILTSISSLSLNSLSEQSDYRISHEQVTSRGFFLVVTNKIPESSLQLTVDWIAFDYNSQIFGEVIQFTQNNTGDLGQFYDNSNEHRVQTTKVNFTRSYTQVPGIALFLTGASNKGADRLINANYTNVTPFSFDLSVFAWHHTDLSEYSFSVLVYFTDECMLRTGKEYINEERDQSAYSWTTLPIGNNKINKEFRSQHYILPITGGLDPLKSSSLMYADFVHSGFVGYEFRNVILHDGQTNIQIKNIELAEDRKNIEMDVGTWGKSILTGAYWNYIVCETEGEFILPNPFSSLAMALVGGCILVIVVVGIITGFQVKKARKEKDY